MTTYEAVLDFWFNETTPKQWFQKDETFDEVIRKNFSDSHAAASHCETAHWRDTTRGRLAEVIVLDQFSRNLYRETAQAFSQDPLALVLAQETIAQGKDLELTTTERAFLYMPFMHSESALIHEEALRLYQLPRLESNYDSELQHKMIIDQFGRYPHRNKFLVVNQQQKKLIFLRIQGQGFRRR